MRLLDSYADVLASRRSLVVGLIGVVSVLAGLGYLRDKPDGFAGVKALQSRQEGIRQADQLYHELRDQFDLQRPEQILVMSSPRSLDRIDIRAMRSAVNALKQLPQVGEAFWLDDLPDLNVFGLADPLLPPDGASAESFEQSRKEILANPIAVGQLISADGKVLLAPIRMDWLMVTSDKDVREAVLTVVREAADQNPGHQVTFETTGDIPLFLDQMTAHRRNQLLFQVIGYSLVLCLAIVIYRSLIPVLLVSTAPAVAIFWSLGVLRWLGEPNNPLSDAVLPVLIAIVGITDGVHLLAHVRRSYDETRNPLLAASSAVRHVGLACLLTSVTTAIGFASLMWADSELVQGFGRACSIGVCLAFVSMVTVLPILAGTRLAKWLPESKGSDLIESGLGRWQGWVDVWLKHRRLVSGVGIGLTIVLSTSLFFLKPDEKRSFGQPVRSPSFQALQRCDESVGGIELAQVLIQWPRGEQTRDEDPGQELLSVVGRVEGILAEQPLLRHPLSINQVLLALPGAANSRRPLDFLSLLPTALRRAIYREDLGRTIVSVRFQDVGIAAYEPVFQQLRGEFDRLEAEFPGYQIRLTGDAVVRSRKIVQVVKDLEKSLVGAALIIFTLLAVVYRSLRIGLIAVVPNLLPIVTTATMLVVLGRNLDVSAACAFTVCLGIAVDDTIHFVSRFLQERERLGDTDEAIRVTYRKVGSALIVTTIIMVVGFSTVLVSEMPAQQIFGAMAVCTISAALFGDLIFLPALLSWFGPPSKQATPGEGQPPPAPGPGEPTIG